jgi:hypothetical protein
MTFATLVPLGHFVTATAIGPDGNTSEFSACREVCQPNDADCDDVLNAVDNCPGAANTGQTNSDGDIHGDACDNCQDVDNALQLNSDADVLGDACDNCPTVTNPAQEDGDVDLVGDPCDNCRVVPNSNQANWDGDQFGDACDSTGDVDCDRRVNAIDALYVLRHAAALPAEVQNEPCLDIGQMAPYGWAMGDVDCSGSVNAVDALLILRTKAGLPVFLPSGCWPVLVP